VGVVRRELKFVSCGMGRHAVGCSTGIRLSAGLSACMLKFSVDYSAGTPVSAHLTTGRLDLKGRTLIFLFFNVSF
jgi:hypothetical protein